MVLKAVCVLKGTGETNGVVNFEQEVKFCIKALTLSHVMFQS